MFDRERPSFEDSNNVTVQRCFFAYEFAKPFIENKIIADIGCADGYGTTYLADFAKEATGVDYSETTLKKARQKHGHKSNLSFKQGSVPPLPFNDESLDVVTSFQFIEHIHDRIGFIKEVYRVLKPGGVFLCSTPNALMSIARNPFHVHEYTFNEMENEVKNIFNNYEFKGLQGNNKVNTYYEQNARWAKKILKLDPLGLHKLVPANWLTVPYNFLTTLMRNKLKEQNNETIKISTKDFFLTNDNLNQTWDIYLVASK
ncbi:MAG: class I SAM-dependent methyltransferase [Bacteroidia bacterium]